MNQLAHLISSVIRSGVNSEEPVEMENWIRLQRLEPLIYGVEKIDRSFRPEFIEECRQAYFNMAGRAVLFAGESERLVNHLKLNGLPAFAWRGVVYGKEIYGDPALRYCTDIDVMVGPDDREEALDSLLNYGYRLRSSMMPRWFMSRHHLHWPLIRKDGLIPVDLHWAVDHPYRDMNLRESLAELQTESGKLRLAIYHAEKESRLRNSTDEIDFKKRLLQEGPILPWIDLSLLISRMSPTDIEEAVKLIKSHGHDHLWNRTAWVLKNIMKLDVPFPVDGECDILHSTSKIAHRIHGWKIAQSFARRFGCRVEALTDWAEFLFPANKSRSRAADTENILMRFFRIVRLGIDAVICGLWIFIQKMSGRRTRTLTT